MVRLDGAVLSPQEAMGVVFVLLLAMLAAAGAGGYVLGMLTGHRARRLWRRRRRVVRRKRRSR